MLVAFGGLNLRILDKSERSSLDTQWRDLASMAFDDLRMKIIQDLYTDL